jgi:acetyl esterase
MATSSASPVPLDPQLRRFLDEAPALGPAKSPQQARERMEAPLAERRIPGLPNAVQTQDRRLGSGIPIRIYTPASTSPRTRPSPVLVHLHGGGWVAGSIATHDPFCRLLAQKASIAIVSVGYRLAPEHPYPAALADVEEALTWTVANGPSFHADPGRLGLSGDSAGGNLAAVIANLFAARTAAALANPRTVPQAFQSSKQAPEIRALALLYPVTDFPSPEHASYGENATGYGLEADGMRWFWQQYAPSADPQDPALSPLRAQLPAHLPPTLVTTAGYDVLRDEGIAYAQKLRDAGVPVTHRHDADMHHNFPVSPSTVARFPQCDAALAAIAQWLRSTL